MIAPAPEANRKGSRPFIEGAVEKDLTLRQAYTRETIDRLDRYGGPREVSTVELNCDSRTRDAMVPR